MSERTLELNREANDLTNRAERAERLYELARGFLRRIAEEPPNRGRVPNFRSFAQDALKVLDREGRP